MTEIDRLIFQMITFDQGDAARIQHFMKVYEFSHLIGAAEGLNAETMHVLEAAAVLHDIGIIPCEKEFGHCTGKMQEEYGPAHAQTLLQENGGYTETEIQRICFLIGHHHTYSAIDGIDYQILVEADFLVNAYEDGMKQESILTVRERLFQTAAGTALLNTSFGLEETCKAGQ